MSDNLFNPDAFLNDSVDAALSTRMEPVPEGDYPATIKSVATPRFIESKDPTKPGFAVMDITWSLDAPQLAQKLGRNELLVRQGVMLDLKNGKLDTDKGRNIGLGRLREAVKQNQAGKQWNPSMLVGAGPAMVKVTHRADKNDDSVVYDEIRKVAPIN